MSEHSPEPWDLGEAHESMCQILDVNGNRVGTLKASTLLECCPYPETNARRIVAAVNFCRQFPTDWLEKRQLVHAGAEKDNIRSASDIRGFEGFVPCTLIPVAKEKP